MRERIAQRSGEYCGECAWRPVVPLPDKFVRVAARSLRASTRPNLQDVVVEVGGLTVLARLVRLRLTLQCLRDASISG